MSVLVGAAAASASVRVSVGGGSRIPELPFDIPSRATLAASSKQVVAHWHYFPRYIGSATNDYYAVHLITPDGENNKHTSYGGWMSERPLPVAPARIVGDWEKDMMFEDIKEAAAIGIDAFFKNSWSDLPNDNELKKMFDAADDYNSRNDPDFHISIELDAFIIGGSASPTLWADRVAPYLNRSSYYKYNGKYVVAVFKAEMWSASWYQTFVSHMRNAYGKDVVFIPSFNLGPTSVMDPYASLVPSIIPVINIWQTYSPTDSPTHILKPHRDWTLAHGGKFMGTVHHNHGSRPSFDQVESLGLSMLQKGWLSSIQSNDAMLQIQTWNDHWEEQSIRPSTAFQYGPYDISAYYLTWFKTGTPPPIVRDTIYYAHRMHLTSAPYDSTKQARPFTITGVPATNSVYTMAFLKAPADVKVISGGNTHTHAAPAGVSLFADPLFANDQPKFSAIRSGTTVVPQFSSAFRTRGSVVWQDLHYRMGGSRRPPVPGVQNNLPEDRL